MAALAPTVSPSRLRYQRREPEHTRLWQLVAAEAPGLRDALAAQWPDTRLLPRHVDKELDAFLECGQLTRGFARVVCRSCRAEHLVAFSCKGRGICPSCTARRMSDTAAHLLDRVLPYARYRQWVVTFPRRVRAHLAIDPKLAAAALTQVLRAIFAWQKHEARKRGEAPARAHSNAAVTFVQRFNSALELSLHFHILIPDGVFLADVRDPDARPRLATLPAPTTEVVAALLDRIIARITRLCAKRLRLDDVPEIDDAPLHLALQPASRNAPFIEDPLPPLCARKDGYSLHAGRAVEPRDRQGLEQLCRYGLRPPLSQGRLTRDHDGTVRYQMKRRFRDGRHVLGFTPREFLLRLCALVPPPRFHMVRYAGLFSAHARGRYALTGRGLRPLRQDHDARAHHGPPASPPTASPSPPSPTSPSRSPSSPTLPSSFIDRPALPGPHLLLGPDEPARPRRLEWAALLRRTFGLDVLDCPRCHRPMELLATIDDRLVARRILLHLRLPTRPPPPPPPWQPQPALPLPPLDPDPCVDPPLLLD